MDWYDVFVHILLIILIGVVIYLLFKVKFLKDLTRWFANRLAILHHDGVNKDTYIRKFHNLSPVIFSGFYLITTKITLKIYLLVIEC